MPRLRRAEIRPASEPKLIDKREQVLDPLTAYQITSIMEGVIQRGTGAVDQGGRQASRRQDRHDQRRQGSVVHRLSRPTSRSASSSATTSRARWAIPRRPRTYAAPIFRDFMKMALKDKPDMPFRVPPGIKLISVDVEDRHCARPAQGSILEAFKPGTAPPDSYRPRRRRAVAAGRAGPTAGRLGHGRAVLTSVREPGVATRR